MNKLKQNSKNNEVKKSYDLSSFIDFDSKTIKEYINISNSVKGLSKNEEFNLLTNIKNKNCQESRGIIFKNYLRTAISLAKKYCYRTHLPLSDAIQAGVLGILKSIDNFDINEYKNITKNTGSLFGYYTYRSILMELVDYYRINYRQFSVSDSTNTKLQKINKLYMSGVLNDKSPNQIIEFLSKTFEEKPTKMKFLLDLFKTPVELDKPIDEDSMESDTYKDILSEFNDRTTPSMNLSNNEDLMLLNSSINELEKTEQNILKDRYGINCHALSLEELGKKYKSSGPNIRYKLIKIQNKLKNILLSKK